MNPTAVALIVAPGDRESATALRYVIHLPDSAPAVLRVHASSAAFASIEKAAVRRHVACSRMESPEVATRCANLAIIVGESPFSPRDVEILEEQGVVVEWRGRYAGRQAIGSR
jgi:hypothetical protein